VAHSLARRRVAQLVFARLVVGGAIGLAALRPGELSDVAQGLARDAEVVVAPGAAHQEQPVLPAQRAALPQVPPGLAWPTETAKLVSQRVERVLELAEPPPEQAWLPLESQEKQQPEVLQRELPQASEAQRLAQAPP
jgi:hypothetical protein